MLKISKGYADIYINMSFKQVKIFYDGNNINKYVDYPYVVGITTNSTFVAQSDFTSYSKFMETYSDKIKGRPISLQVWSEDNMADQARKLSALGNVYIKIAVKNSSGKYNIPLINTLLEEGIKVNITCVYTEAQLNELTTSLVKTSTPVIVSVFAGGISDAGHDPLPTIVKAVTLFKDQNNVEILWAGCKDNASIINADNVGCHIITLPDSIMDRMNRIGTNLENMTVDKVKLFNNDARNLSF
jgi:transaldolase